MWYKRLRILEKLKFAQRWNDKSNRGLGYAAAIRKKSSWVDERVTLSELRKMLKGRGDDRARTGRRCPLGGLRKSPALARASEKGGWTGS